MTAGKSLNLPTNKHTSDLMEYNSNPPVTDAGFTHSKHKTKMHNDRQSCEKASVK